MSFREKTEVWVDREVARDSLLGKIISNLRKTGITREIRHFLVKSQYRKEKKNPTEKMIEAKVFFENQKEKIAFNAELLSDSESKDVYLKMIRFRYTHDISEYPSYNLFNSYFVEGITPHEDNGVFIDCGAYTGDSAQSYLKYNSGNYKKIVCFEPDEENYNKLKRNFSSFDNVEIVKAGVWDSDTQLCFQSGGGSASNVIDDNENVEGIVKIKVCSIDGNPYCQDATFIKMDIEGSEYNALCGAVNVIKKNRPILAICIYHSNEDMIRLIQWINDLKLNYSFYVRQHSFDESDTVLYAIPIGC